MPIDSPTIMEITDHEVVLWVRRDYAFPTTDWRAWEVRHEWENRGEATDTAGDWTRLIGRVRVGADVTALAGLPSSTRVPLDLLWVADRLSLAGAIARKLGLVVSLGDVAWINRGTLSFDGDAPVSVAYDALVVTASQMMEPTGLAGRLLASGWGVDPGEILAAITDIVADVTERIELTGTLSIEAVNDALFAHGLELDDGWNGEITPSGSGTTDITPVPVVRDLVYDEVYRLDQTDLADLLRDLLFAATW